MPDVATCPHGDHPACCLDCLDGPPPPSARPAPRTRSAGSGYVIAEFDGWCPACDDEVLPGEKIVEHEPGRWGHLSCQS